MTYCLSRLNGAGEDRNKGGNKMNVFIRHIGQDEPFHTIIGIQMIFQIEEDYVFIVDTVDTAYRYPTKDITFEVISTEVLKQVNDIK